MTSTLEPPPEPFWRERPRTRPLLRIVRTAVVLIAVVALVLLYVTQPIGSVEKKESVVKVEAARLRAHVKMLAGTLVPRNAATPANLDRAAVYIRDRFAEAGGETSFQEFDVDGRPHKNVIARYGPAAGERVVVGAHYDAAGPGMGADDNASGVAALLEAARLITAHAFRYSVWFVFSAGEEQGALGSKHLVGWLSAQGYDVRGAIVPDMIGYWPNGGASEFDILGDPSSTSLVGRMADMSTSLGVAHRSWIQHGYCYGDDQTTFQDAGIAAIAVMDCVDAHNVPAAGESTPHYHRTTDTSGTLDLPMTAKVVGVMVATMAALAEPVEVTSP